MHVHARARCVPRLGNCIMAKRHALYTCVYNSGVVFAINRIDYAALKCANSNTEYCPTNSLFSLIQRFKGYKLDKLFLMHTKTKMNDRKRNYNVDSHKNECIRGRKQICVCFLFCFQSSSYSNSKTVVYRGFAVQSGSMLYTNKDVHCMDRAFSYL